jgi:hypothetical protein
VNLMSRYRIEYLTETTEEESVCHVLAIKPASLRAAGDAAFAGFAEARRAFGAGGFQIRDMNTENARIVALETIDSD